MLSTEPVSPVLGAPLTEYLAEQIPKVARHSHARYRSVPADDYQQAMWLEILTRPHRFQRPWEEGRLNLVRKRLYDAANKIRNEDDRYRRTVKAAESGYSTEDLQFYSTGLLAMLLPALLEANWDTGEAMQRASSGVDAAGVFIRASDPFSGAENYLVMLIDVKAAWGKLTEGQRRLLSAYYSCDQEDTESGRWERGGLAASMGLTDGALRVRVHRAVEALQEKLGGEDPWRR